MRTIKYVIIKICNNNSSDKYRFLFKIEKFA